MNFLISGVTRSNKNTADVKYEIIFTLRVSAITTTLPLFLTGKYEKNAWKTQDDYMRRCIKKKQGL
jgi:hypothetical protein